MRKQFITLLLCLGSILGAQAQNERANQRAYAKALDVIGSSMSMPTTTLWIRLTSIR